MKATRSSYSALEKRPDDGLFVRLRSWFYSLPFVPYPDLNSTPRLQTSREALALKGKRKLAVRRARERGISVPGGYRPLDNVTVGGISCDKVTTGRVLLPDDDFVDE